MQLILELSKSETKSWLQNEEAECRKSAINKAKTILALLPVEFSEIEISTYSVSEILEIVRRD